MSDDDFDANTANTGAHDATDRAQNDWWARQRADYPGPRSPALEPAPEAVSERETTGYRRFGAVSSPFEGMTASQASEAAAESLRKRLEYRADKGLRGASNHCPPPDPQVEACDDPFEAVAIARAVMLSGDRHSRAAATEGLRARIAKLADPDSDEALTELAAHLPVLSDAFLRNMAWAASTRNAEASQKHMKMGLAAQLSFGRTLALIAGLKAQRKGKASVIVEQEES